MTKSNNSPKDRLSDVLRRSNNGGDVVRALGTRATPDRASISPKNKYLTRGQLVRSLRAD